MEENNSTSKIMQEALWELNVEIQSLLHANQLKSESIESKKVIAWLQGLSAVVRQGLGKEK